VLAFSRTDHRGMTRPPVTDQQLHAAVLRRFEWSPEIHGHAVGVAVRDGIVTLSGAAGSAAEKRAAVRSAREVQGVLAVVDEIAVPTAVGAVDDPDVAADVRAALGEHPALEAERITVGVHHQVVTLSGGVNSLEQRRAARRCAQAVLGVRAVIDELTLPPAPTASQTKARLVEVFGRAGSAHVDEVDIKLDGHVATLEGNVHSWYERRAAEKAARSVPGITDVRNKLVVTF